jgi:hypothetical protein
VKLYFIIAEDCTIYNIWQNKTGKDLWHSRMRYSFRVDKSDYFWRGMRDSI